MPVLNKILAAAIAGCLVTIPSVAFAGDAAKPAMTDNMVMVGDIHVSDHWARAMLPGQKVGGGYVTLKNSGSADDRLVSVSTSATDRAEIHEMAVVDDVMRMRQLKDGLVIGAGETVTLKPGGFHMMFMAVEKPFVEGEMVPVTLVFEKAGPVDLMLPILPARTKKMDHSTMDHGVEHKKTN